MAEGLDFLIPSLLFMKGALLAGLVPSAGLSAGPFHGDQPVRLGALSEGHFVQTCSCRRRHSYAEGVPANVVLAHQL